MKKYVIERSVDFDGIPTFALIVYEGKWFGETRKFLAGNENREVLEHAIVYLTEEQAA